MNDVVNTVNLISEELGKRDRESDLAIPSLLCLRVNNVVNDKMSVVNFVKEMRDKIFNNIGNLKPDMLCSLDLVRLLSTLASKSSLSLLEGRYHLLDLNINSKNEKRRV